MSMTLIRTHFSQLNPFNGDHFVSEFLLGESILAAPVLEQGAVTRHIYLPRGTWTDGNTKATIYGPKWIMNYPAPLHILPHFIRRG